MKYFVRYCFQNPLKSEVRIRTKGKEEPGSILVQFVEILTTWPVYGSTVRPYD